MRWRDATEGEIEVLLRKIQANEGAAKVLAVGIESCVDIIVEACTKEGE